MLKFLSLLRDILYYTAILAKKIAVAIKLKKVGEAFEKSKNDQKPIEEVISDVSGRPTKYEYDGLRTREDKKRS